ncbi:BCS1 N terminal-domain-containing protein [Annulohypoxylon maeteangense]|uniref:BCS1 N terminal-domain-containing protein n=1 Tax=Annulohypoxylon maeteangense TaxID=1927788 RepID=UPI0020074D04|nr:BCS1 N terminal-domain-containing protein [Annulohypoxylon maeteangense]KAI0887980.1 BCS1 N terminal-domain-containing protein [Annulohypoxylon maeteangense]
MAGNLSVSSTEANPSGNPAYESSTGAPQLAMLDIFFPGFSMFAGAVQKYLKIDLNLYIPLLLITGALTVVWNYASIYLWEQLETHFMSVVDVRTDDEVYNIIMSWVARQKFSQGARRFVVNTNVNSRCWYIWDCDDDDDEDDDYERESSTRKKKPLSYTPSFGSHYFWYRGRLLLFRRSAKEQQKGWALVSQCEEISISCFGRDPWILKELLLEARQEYMKKDEHKTLIYRGTLKPGSMETTWQRCMARASRPFSTVILNEKVKQELIDDVTDYLDPATQRWYANRGIPYRRGYLLYGPPGTGKSSLSLALAGFFKMRIYIVSLSSITANEENLASLFAELPRRCVVLLEDIDTAGLTHTRENETSPPPPQDASNDMVPGQLTTGNGNAEKNTPGGRLSLSGLLNILDGVASQEGRILIMTTNHLEKLDAALIRPGRVDITVKFGLADEGMSVSIFRAIFARLDGDEDPNDVDKQPTDPEVRAKLEEEKKKMLAVEDARISALAKEFSAKVPTHEFSPAELQGYLMKHKRHPQRAVENVEEFIEQTRKDHKEKRLKEAEEKRKEEAKRKEEQEKKDEEKAKKEAEAQNKDTSEQDADKEATEDSKSSSETSDDKKESSAVEKKERLEVKTESGHVKNDSGYVTPASGEP